MDIWLSPERCSIHIEWPEGQLVLLINRACGSGELSFERPEAAHEECDFYGHGPIGLPISLTVFAVTADRHRFDSDPVLFPDSVREER